MPEGKVRKWQWSVSTEVPALAIVLLKSEMSSSDHGSVTLKYEALLSD